MYGDELTLAYDSYSILKTGMDQTGQYLPLTTKMGAGRPAGYVYASLPFIAIFGPTEIGIRMLSLLSGTILIIAVYFLALKIFENNENKAKIALFASFLQSISIWDISLSKGGFEAHFALLLAAVGVLMFLYRRYILTALLWGITIFTYPTFKLTLPLIFIVLITTFKKTTGDKPVDELNADMSSSFRRIPRQYGGEDVIFYEGYKNLIISKKFWVSILVLLFFTGVSLFETSKGLSESRFLSISILTNKEIEQRIIQKINNQRFLSPMPEVVDKLFFNKPFEYTRLLIDNYVENFNFSYLFLRGDRNPRHNPTEFGSLYLIEFVTILIGITSIYKKDRRNFIFLVFWILITPLATMLMGQTHALRNGFMLPPLILISAYGIYSLRMKSRFVVILFILVQFMIGIYYINSYIPVKFADFWSAEAKNATILANQSLNKYDKIVISSRINDIEYAYPAYSKIDPFLVISNYGKFPKVYGRVIIDDDLEKYKSFDSVVIISEDSIFKKK